MATERITKRQVQALFIAVCDIIPAPEGEMWTLEVNQPGGPIRISFGSSKRGDFVQSQPLDNVVWQGYRAAWKGLRMMSRTAQYVNGLDRPSPRSVVAPGE